MSSLISSIRSCQDSETFDLGGQSLATITHVMESAFREPFDLVDEDMIKFTFVVGAGKQARSKYDASTGKVVTQILRDTCGYQEDRGASCSVECAGTYKVQHDTGKNLFTVIVFPKLTSKIITKCNDGSQPDLEDEEPLVPHDSPGYKIATCTVSVFPQMMKVKCPTWTEKKSMLQCLEALQALVQDLETQLMHGQDLSTMENEFYNAVVELDEKHSLLKHEMQVQVMETQQLTKEEQQLLLEQCSTKLAKLQQQNSNKKNKAEIIKLQQRQEVLVSLKGSTMEYPKLKHYADMSKLYNEVAKIGGLHIEETTKGRLCTVKETQILTRKQEIMEELEYLEEASRNWFEDTDMFDKRVEQTRQQLSLKYWNSQKSKSFKHNKKMNASSIANMNSKLKVGSNNNNKWVTPGQKEHHNHWTSALAAKKKKRPKGGALFQAMMMDDSDDDSHDDDDDDDSEDDSEEDERQQQQTQYQPQRTTAKTAKRTASATTTPTTPTKKKPSNIQKSSIHATSDDDDDDEKEEATTTATNSSPKKSKKKKSKKNKKNKKSKGSSGREDDGDEDNVLNRAVEANQETQRQQEQAKEPTTNLDHVRIILVDYLLPFVGAILAWLVTLVFGASNKKKKKKTT